MTLAFDPSVVAWLDQEDRRTAEIVRTHGVYVQFIGGDVESLRAPFAYTVGLHGIGHPELLVVGIGPHASGMLLGDVAAQVRAGRVLTPGDLLSFDDWAHRVTVETVPNPGEIVFSANRFFSRPDEQSVPVLQLTYDDREGRFPWEDGYANASWIQPRPGQLTAW